MDTNFICDKGKGLIAKEQGGLGVKDVSKHNKSLLLEWWWNMAKGASNHWKEVVHTKYGNWISSVPRRIEPFMELVTGSIFTI